MQGGLGMLGDAIEWKLDDAGQLRPYLRSSEQLVIWAPLPGSQRAYLECPFEEVLYEGGRGFGKSDCLLMDFAQHVGQGFGNDWRGIIFRRTKPELRDIVNTSKRWFHLLFPNATYNEVRHEWKWSTGEVLTFAHFDDEEDYWTYHGQQFTFIGWEELTTWATDGGYRRMFSCLRSTNPRVPRKVRANTNPYGIGHSWVKARFELPGPKAAAIVGPLIHGRDGKVIRTSVHGHLRENFVLLHAEPGYADRLRENAESPEMLKAWIDGDWNIAAGGMFNDLWMSEHHVIPYVPPHLLPRSWVLDRSYDDGQAKPFSVGFWAESSGDVFEWEGRRFGVVKGDIIRVNEWYGWSGQPNHGLMMGSYDVAREIQRRQAEMEIQARIRPGPADTNIWNSSAIDPSRTVASEMQRGGITWLRADKGPGSREQGWKVMRELLRGAIPDENGRRERPGLFVMAVCKQFIRTIPVLPRDEKNPDDIDTDAEDHIADEVRYRVRRPLPVTKMPTAAIY